MNKLSYEKVKLYVENEGYTLVSEGYIDGGHKLNMLCPYGHKVSMTLRLFKDGKRCRLCSSSRGENTIRFILKEILPIQAEEQKSVMYKGNNYNFDFYIKLDRGLFIEYDGEQHFRPIDFWGGEEGFKAQQYRDSQKTEYVKWKKGELLRVPYNKNKEEVYQMIVQFLSDKIDIKPLPVERLAEAEYCTKYDFTMNEVVDYYKDHSIEETVKQYNLHEATIRRYFIQIYGVSKKALKKKQIKEDMAEYYLTHSNKDTQKKFNVSDKTLQAYFKEVYGTDKTSYLKVSTS